MSNLSPNTKVNSLSKQVSDTITAYFESLGDEFPVDLYKMVLEEVEVPLLEKVMKHVGNNQSLAAQILGLSRTTLRTKLKKYFDDQYCQTRDE